MIESCHDAIIRIPLLLAAGGYSTDYAHDPEEAAKYTETDKA
jgi:hypothetical protein